jgi:capsular polysaccharide biosynthesis protein
VPDGAPGDPADYSRPLATLVTFHYLRSAVRRRWRICAAFAVIGLVLSAAYLKEKPASHTATATLRLVHSAQVDPAQAIATDISLVSVRAVAERTIKALGLHMAPQDMTDKVTAVPTGSTQVLQLQMSAPTDAEAVRWLDVFSKQYLSFRAVQISEQPQMLIKGYEKQINDLQSQAEALRKQIERFSSSKQTPDQLTEAVTELSQISNKIGALQGTVDDQTLQQRATVLASSVIDPAAVTSPGRMKRLVMVLLSGLIGGLAVSWAVIVLRAIVSDRLWLRTEVAAALNAPVLLSVRRITPLPRPLRALQSLPWLRAARLRRDMEKQRVSGILGRTLLHPGRGSSLAVLCLDNSDEMRFGLAAAAVDLQSEGFATTLVDLTDQGTAESALAHTGRAPDARPTVFRPSVVPSRAEPPTRMNMTARDDVALANGQGGATLILADFDPAIGVDHLAAWSQSVVLAVTAGNSSVELIRTAGDLVRAAGLRLEGAIVLRTVHDDLSSGVAPHSADPDTQASNPISASRPEAGVGRSLSP